jgi:iron-sulfur cluster assembly protein
MQTVETTTNTPQDKEIRISQPALQRMKELRHQIEGDVCLRIGVRQGGCSGLTYVMNFDDIHHHLPGDKMFDFDGLKVVCDPKSLECVEGLIIDFNHSVLGIGGEFQFMNPSAEATCCCGQSFATEVAA